MPTGVNLTPRWSPRSLNLSKADRESLEIGACLHDIGKVGLDEQPPSKAEPSDRDDTENMKRHTDIGMHMTESLALSADVVAIIRHHHEYYDGSGYPDGLKGEDIPYLARIVCIANEFDWFLTRRSEQDPTVQEEAKGIRAESSGAMF